MNITLKFKSISVLLALWLMALSSVGMGGNEVGGNGDHLSGWFSTLGREIVAKLETDKLSNEPWMQYIDPSRVESILKAQIVTVGKNNEANLQNKYGEIKDVKVVFEDETHRPIIFIKSEFWQPLYEKSNPDLRMVLHAYLYAAGYDDVNYVLSSRVPLDAIATGSPPVNTVPELTLPSFTIEGDFPKAKGTKDGGVIAVRMEHKTRDYEVFLERYGNNGRRIWSTQVNPQGTPVNTANFIETKAGSYLVFGTRHDDRGEMYVYISLFDNSGTQISWHSYWRKYEIELSFKTVVELANGDFAALTSKDIFLLDASGAEGDLSHYQISRSVELTTMALTANNELLAVGQNGTCPYVLRLDIKLADISERCLDSADSLATDLMIDPDGSAYLSVVEYSFDMFGHHKGKKLVLIHLNAHGDELNRFAVIPMNATPETTIFNVHVGRILSGPPDLLWISLNTSYAGDSGLIALDLTGQVVRSIRILGIDGFSASSANKVIVMSGGIRKMDLK